MRDLEADLKAAGVVARVVQDEILEMHEFAVDLERRAGVGEIGAFDEALTHRRTCNPFIETHERGSSLGNGV